MSEYTLHWISGSPNSWRVLLTLHYMGIEYQSRRINPANWDREASGFFSLNPRGKVPVLEINGTAIYESIAIMAYLQTAHPESPIFGKSAIQTALIWQRISEFTHYMLEPVYALSRLIIHDAVLDDVKNCKQLVVNISDELKTLDNLLCDTDYIVGEKITAADIYVYPAIAFLLKVLSPSLASQLEIDFYPLDIKLKNLSQWMLQIEKTKGFDDAYPPHWRDQ